MQNYLKMFFKKVNSNFQEDKKELSAFIKEFQSNSDAAKFQVTAPKINCFYKNITELINQGKVVLIYGDYDVDGIFSTTMLIEYLEALADLEAQKNPQNLQNILKFKKNIHTKIPTRDDGYGIGIDYCKAVLNSKNIDYIITCDNGTHKPMQEIINNKDYEDKVFVFDHHFNGDFDAYANVINPNKDGKIEISTGILLYRFFTKLAQNKKIELPELADLAAFTAISDVACLDSNRDIVEKGLNIINNAYANFNNINDKINVLQEKAMQEYNGEEFSQKGERHIKRISNLIKKQDDLKSLAEHSRFIYRYLFNDKRDKQITIKDLAFGAIPKFNAINRTGADATFLIYMLKCKNLSKKEKIEVFNNYYEMLNNMNDRRKKIAGVAVKEAMQQIKNSNTEHDPLIYVKIDNLYIGISGLVASKIHEKTGADVIVVGYNKKENLVFSGRGNNIFNNLKILANEFSEDPSIKFGGHEKALGGTIIDEEKFLKQLKESIDKKILIQHKQDPIDFLKNEFKILSKPVTLFELVELSKILTKRNGGIPYSKNFLAPVMVTDDMVTNYNDTLAKTKTKDFVCLNLEFTNPESESIESIKFIANSEEASELLAKSKNDYGQAPVFLLELSNNCYDNFKDTFSGKICYLESVEPSKFLETQKPMQKMSNKPTTGLKL